MRRQRSSPMCLSTSRREMLAQEAAELARDYPRLTVLPVAADFTQSFRLPPAVAGLARAGFFPGSTIGNFEPHDAAAFLRHAGRMLGTGAILILGVDLVKETGILNAAYNDAAGVTAKFNLNLLVRINRELGGDLDLDNFCHQAFYNSERRRVEMHLASRKRQTVHICGRQSNSVPARPSTPKAATNTQSNALALWRAVPAGHRLPPGRIRKAISRCRRSWRPRADSSDDRNGRSLTGRTDSAGKERGRVFGRGLVRIAIDHEIGLSHPFD